MHVKLCLNASQSFLGLRYIFRRYVLWANVTILTLVLFYYRLTTSIVEQPKEDSPVGQHLRQCGNEGTSAGMS